MEVKQVYELINTVTQEIIGNTALVQEDLSNIVDVGNTIQNTAGIDNYVKSLVDHIGKVIFVNRPYAGTASSVLMDGWEYGSIMEKITYDELPTATENESWDLNDGQSYDVNVFTQPKVSAKFYNKRLTFEIPMSFAERQVKSSFSNATQLNSFFSMIYNSVENSMTVKTDSLISRTINNMIAESVVSNTPRITRINLLADFNTRYGKNLTLQQAITDPEFIRYASYIINLTRQRITKISTLYNLGGKERFTPLSSQHLILLSEFEAAARTYLYSDTFNKNEVTLPKAETVPYWQSPGTTYSFDNTSRLYVKTSSGASINAIGIIGVLFDRNALGVANLDRRVTTNYNAKGEFFNNWYKFDSGYFNDFNENFVVFYMQTTTPTEA